MTLRDDLFGSGIAAAAGVEAMEEAAAEPVDIVLSAIVGAAGPEGDRGGDPLGQRHRARQQGMPDLRRQRLHGARARSTRCACCRSIPSTTRSTSSSTGATRRTSAPTR